MLAALPILMLFAQAEPAPAGVPDPGIAQEAPPESNVGFDAGLGLRLGAAADEVPPAVGFSLSTLLGHRYALVGGWLGLGVTASFGYERHSQNVKLTKEVAPGQNVPWTGVRAMSVFDFAALQTFSVERGRVRPFLGVGAGISLGYFNSPEPAFHPGESRATTALLLGAGGVDIPVKDALDLSLRVEYAHLLPAPTFDTSTGRNVRVFANRLATRLGIRYRF